MKANNNEFYDSELVAIYNTVCPLDGYEKFYIRLAEKLQAKTIIDIGCGTGLLTNELAKKGYSMLGVEPSSLMLAVARKSAYGEKITWIEGDALVLEKVNADLAIMTGHVAQFHLTDDEWDNALQSIYRSLRPGGYIAFESRNPEVQSWNNHKEKKLKDWYSSDFRQKVIDPIAGPIEVWNEIIEVKDKRVTTDIHYLFKNNGKELLSRNTLIFRSKKELIHSLESNGFLVEKIYGNWDESLVTSKSPEFIFVAKRI